jgi:hypothetical protein
MKTIWTMDQLDLTVEPHWTSCTSPQRLTGPIAPHRGASLDQVHISVAPHRTRCPSAWRLTGPFAPHRGASLDLLHLRVVLHRTSGPKERGSGICLRFINSKWPVPQTNVWKERTVTLSEASGDEEPQGGAM